MRGPGGPRRRSAGSPKGLDRLAFRLALAVAEHGLQADLFAVVGKRRQSRRAAGQQSCERSVGDAGLGERAVRKMCLDRPAVASAHRRNRRKVRPAGRQAGSLCCWGLSPCHLHADRLPRRPLLPRGAGGRGRCGQGNRFRLGVVFRHAAHRRPHGPFQRRKLRQGERGERLGGECLPRRRAARGSRRRHRRRWKTGSGTTADAMAGSAAEPRRPRPTETPSTVCSAGRWTAGGASISMGSPANGNRGTGGGESAADRASSIVSSGGGGQPQVPATSAAAAPAPAGQSAAAGLGPDARLAPGEGSSVSDRFQIGNLLEGLGRRFEQPPHALQRHPPADDDAVELPLDLGDRPGIEINVETADDQKDVNHHRDQKKARRRASGGARPGGSTRPQGLPRRWR